MMGSVKRGRPVSQHREFGGPEAAEHGDELRAGTEVVTAIADADVGGGEGGEDVWKYRRGKIEIH